MSILREDHDDYTVPIQFAPQYDEESQDRFFQAVVKFLLQGGDFAEALILVTSELSIYKAYDYEEYAGGLPVFSPSVSIACQRNYLETLAPQSGRSLNRNASTQKIDFAIKSVLGHSGRIYYSVRYSPINVSDLLCGWRETYFDIARRDGVTVNNQGLSAETSPNGTVREDLSFGSKSEARVAAALDRHGVMFFPLCSARLGPTGNRKRREPDFLICHEGKWGILEVDGPHHTGHIAEDRARDDDFQYHGVRVVRHYKSDECYEKPDWVVNDFLNKLRTMG